MPQFERAGGAKQRAGHLFRAASQKIDVTGCNCLDTQPFTLDSPAPPALNYGNQLPYRKRQEYEVET